jgi:PIN domain nuclease of toxin-antitoxin system
LKLLELAHATFIETLAPHHTDPFDRLLIAQSLLETMPIVSAEVLFDQYGVSRMWR